MENSGQIILVTGAASSGKSEWAEHLALQSAKPVIYIATAKSEPTDEEWAAKIEKHRQRRPANWQTWEIPVHLTTAIARSSPQHCLLVDSLGTWVANLLEQEQKNWELTAVALLKNMERAKVDLILVAEETGWGVVPAYESGRLFRNRLGKLVRQIGTRAELVYLVTGGYALNLTLLGQKLPSG
jgi:adenosylcobinamide kinase/adenosylcobinamide-phosphate guanylyltransferase